MVNNKSTLHRSVMHTPLAVRSSSLFEDTFRQPFAGIYKTYFLPNQHESLAFRIKEMCTAIKLVYASTFWAEAKNYMRLLACCFTVASVLSMSAGLPHSVLRR